MSRVAKCRQVSRWTGLARAWRVIQWPVWVRVLKTGVRQSGHGWYVETVWSVRIVGAICVSLR